MRRGLLTLQLCDRRVGRSVPEPVRGEAPGPTFLPNQRTQQCERCGKTIRSRRSVGRLPHCAGSNGAIALGELQKGTATCSHHLDVKENWVCRRAMLLSAGRLGVQSLVLVYVHMRPPNAACVARA